MTFSVNTKALAGLPTFLDRRADDLSAAANYLAAYTAIWPFTLVNMAHVHQRVIAAINSYLLATRLTYAQNDAVRVRAAISSYETSDLRASQRTDAAIAGLPRDLRIAPPLGRDLLSPTSIVRDAVWRITSIAADIGLLDRPIDPLQEILPPFIGDWAGLLRCADVFDNLGAMLGLSQDCVDDADNLVSTI